MNKLNILIKLLLVGLIDDVNIGLKSSIRNSKINDLLS